MAKKIKIGLALSGGSAYGLAHIGVLSALQENGITPSIIAGTSMGAIVGGFFSAGVSPAKMQEFLAHFSRSQIVDFSLFSIGKGGLLKGEKVVKFFKSFVKDKNIEDCAIKFCCVASDIKSGKKHVFHSGNMVRALRASMSVPGIFLPVEMDGMVLVDGGAHDNLPVEEVRKLGADVVIAVDVCSFYKPQDGKSAVDVIIDATNLLVSNLINAQKDKGDVLIKIDQPDVHFDKFIYAEAQKSIERGKQATLECMPIIKQVVEKASKSTNSAKNLSKKRANSSKNHTKMN